MIGESIKFMIIGMSVVFLFLVIMVFVLEVQHRIINRLVENKVASKDNDKKTGISSDTIDAKTTAVISAAVKHHVEQNK